MPNKFLMLIACVVALAWTAPPASAAQTGNELLADCIGDQNALSYCAGYISGVEQTLSMWEDMTGTCIDQMPDLVTAGQGMDIIVAYLRTNPVDRHLPAVGLTMIAFAQAWPCSK